MRTQFPRSRHTLEGRRNGGDPRRDRLDAVPSGLRTCTTSCTKIHPTWRIPCDPCKMGDVQSGGIPRIRILFWLEPPSSGSRSRWFKSGQAVALQSQTAETSHLTAERSSVWCEDPEFC